MDFVKDIQFDDPIPYNDQNTPTDKPAEEAPAEQSDMLSPIQEEPAAAGIIDAGRSYGKLDELAGAGSYSEKAENDGHDYGSKDKVEEEEETEAKKEEGGIAKLAGALKF